MKFYAIGGFEEVGKNMCAVEMGNEVVVVDMGVQVDKLVKLEGGGEEYRKTSTKRLVELGALPNDKQLHGKKVVAIVLSHAHLDHCEAVPRLAEKYGCPILATPYTIEVLKKVLRDEETPHLKKYLHPLAAGSKASVSREFEIELVNVTHSIPQAAIVAVRTREGAFVYFQDYKLDNSPILGDKPDYRKFKQLGREGVKLLVLESLRSQEPGRTPSEAVARLMVKDAIERAYHERKAAVVVTTYSSHIARIRSIIEANRGERKVAMIGRSLLEYAEPAREMKMISTRDIDLLAKKKAGVAAALDKIRREPHEWLIITTGHQGEPRSVLPRIAHDQFKFRFQKDDHVIFSSETIPNPVNIANRAALQTALQSKGVRIFDNIHVSGHARREDDRDIIRMLQPETIVPGHAEKERHVHLATLAEEEGYKIGKTVHILGDGDVLEL